MDFFGGGPLGSSFWMTFALTPAAPPSHLPEGAEVTFLSAHPPYERSFTSERNVNAEDEQTQTNDD